MNQDQAGGGPNGKDGAASADASEGGGAGRILVAVAALVLLVLFHAAFGFKGPIFEGSGLIKDNDSLTRAVRVTDLRADGAWFDTTLDRVNPPLGHTQHWTRPVDALLLAGAVLFEPVLGFDDGLKLWAAIYPPLIHALTLLALVWAFSSLIRSHEGKYYLILLSFFQLTTVAHFLPGRIDQHSLLVLFFVLTLGALVRLVLTPRPTRRFCVLAGAGGAMFLWISVEAIHAVVVALGVAGLGWLVAGRARTAAMLWLTRALAGFTLLFLLIERGFGNLLPSYQEWDRLSLFYFAFTAAMWLFFEAVAVLERLAGRDLALWQRIGLSAGGAGATFLLLAGFNPGLWEGNVYSAELSPERAYKQTRMQFISEGRDVWQTGSREVGGPLPGKETITGLINAAFAAPATLLGLPVLLWLFIRRRGRERWAWVGLALIAAVLVQRGSGLAFRTTTFINLAMLPFVAILFLGLGARIRGLLSGGERTGYVVALNTTLILALFVVVLIGKKETDPRLAAAELADESAANAVPEAGTQPQAEPGSDAEAIEAVEAAPAARAAARAHRQALAGLDLPRRPDQICHGTEIAAWLAHHLPATPMQVIMAHPDQGPELLYFTDHAILSLPNHRPQPGHTATFEAMHTTRAAGARNCLARHGTDYLVVCKGDLLYRMLYGLTDPQAETFGARLVRGDYPDWITPLGAPRPELLADVEIFRVDLPDVPPLGHHQGEAAACAEAAGP